MFRGITSAPARSAVVAAFIIVLSMSISLVGLCNIIKYGYGYCGYFAIAVVIVPFLTVGVYKNRKYLKAQTAPPSAPGGPAPMRRLYRPRHAPPPNRKRETSRPGPGGPRASLRKEGC